MQPAKVYKWQDRKVRQIIERANTLLKRNFIFPALFVLILAVGIFARSWQFGQLPPGLNQDEASIGVEAYDLLHFGMDRNGVSFPVNFISWGSGQNALYGYLLIPFVALGGLTPLMVRLPMLITGILTLPLVFFVAKRMLGKGYGLLAMFLLAISPWHIILSRWGLESNLLPFTFLLGFACLLKLSIDNYWFVPASLFFALSLYAYGTAYAAVPIFILLAIPLLLYSKKASGKSLVLGLAMLLIVGGPIGLLVLVNSLGLASIHIGIFTIHRLPVEARYQSMGAIFSKDFIKAMAKNTLTMVSLLWKQSDGYIWNVVAPYGYFYSITLPVAILGGMLIFPFRKSQYSLEKGLVLCWLAASILIGMLQPVDINRINLIFIPLILCTTVPLYWLATHTNTGFITVVCALIIGFSAFTYTYHGENYRSQANGPFFASFLPALKFVRQSANVPVCVTDHVNMSYIFVLFSEKMDPRTYLQNIEYIDPTASFRHVLKLGRYTFGLSHCPDLPGAIYVLAEDDKALANENEYTDHVFGYFHVLIP